MMAEPLDPRAWKQLEERLYLEKRWGDLVQAYSERAEVLEDEEQRERLFFQAGQLARKAGAWRTLIAAYKKMGESAKGKDAAVFHFLAASVIDEKLKAPEEAERAFRASLEAIPEDARILTAIQAFFERRGLWKD